MCNHNGSGCIPASRLCAQVQIHECCRCMQTEQEACSLTYADMCCCWTCSGCADSSAIRSRCRHTCTTGTLQRCCCSRSWGSLSCLVIERGTVLWYTQKMRLICPGYQQLIIWSHLWGQSRPSGTWLCSHVHSQRQTWARAGSSVGNRRAWIWNTNSNTRCIQKKKTLPLLCGWCRPKIFMQYNHCLVQLQRYSETCQQLLLLSGIKLKSTVCSVRQQNPEGKPLLKPFLHIYEKAESPKHQ